jgi:hypothetical protein
MTSTRSARQRQADPGRLAKAPAHNARPTPRPSCSWCARAIPSTSPTGRTWPARRRRHHAEPQDFRRRALELPGRLGLCAEAAGRQCRIGQGLRQAHLRQHQGAGLGRPRLDHHLRRARHRRRADRLGKRSLPGRQGAGPGQVRGGHAQPVDPGRAAGQRGRQDRRQEGHAQAGPGLSGIPVQPRRPADRRQELLPPARCQGGRGLCQAVHAGEAVHHRRTSAAGAPPRRRTSTMAACSTRSTPRAAEAPPPAPIEPHEPAADCRQPDARLAFGRPAGRHLRTAGPPGPGAAQPAPA